MEIRTERLLLREICENDLEAFHKLQSNPETTRFTKQGPSKSLANSEQMLDDLVVLVNMMRSYEIRGEPVLILAITLPPSIELIGIIGTFRPREIGFSLHPDYWGKGYASEGTKGFCKWYMEQHPGQQLFAKVNTENKRSVGCLTKCGFTAGSSSEQSADDAYGNDRERETWLYRGG